VSQREIRTVYKSVRLAVSESSEAGNYDFCYQIGRQTFRGKTETKLAWMAIRRARSPSHLSFDCSSTCVSQSAQTEGLSACLGGQGLRQKRLGQGHSKSNHGLPIAPAETSFGINARIDWIRSRAAAH
jgi:hypothetical protein